LALSIANNKYTIKNNVTGEVYLGKASLTTKLEELGFDENSINDIVNRLPWDENDQINLTDALGAVNVTGVEVNDAAEKSLTS